MAKPKNAITEFRSYLLPVDFPMIVLTGDYWRISDRPAENLHFHNCLEIGICHEGSGYIQIRGEKTPFHGGDITIIASNIPHTTCSTKGNLSLWSYIFTDPAELFSSFAPAHSAALNALNSRLDTARLIPAKQGEELRFYVTRVLREVTAKEENYDLAARADFLSLLLEADRIIRRQDKKGAEAASSKPAPASPAFSILPALEYIRTNYMSAFSIDDLSTLCGLSPTHFRRLFSQAMETSPLEFVNSVRISKACHLLRSTEDSILNISENVGFRSISSFNRYFQRMVGMSPRDYRRADSSDERVQRTTIMYYSGWMFPEK